MSQPQVTAYDDTASHPGPTVDAVVGGTLAGVAGAALVVLSPTSTWAPLSAMGLAAVASAWTGRRSTSGRNAVVQGIMASGVAVVWVRAAAILPRTVADLQLRVVERVGDTVPDDPEAVGFALAQLGIIGTGWPDAVGRTVLLAVVLGAAGWLGRSALPHAPPRPMDATLFDLVLRTTLGLIALSALLAAWTAGPALALALGPAPAGSADDGSLVVGMWTLPIHALLAGLVTYVIVQRRRLPRTAPETRARLVVDGAVVALTLSALALAHRALPLHGLPLGLVLVVWAVALGGAFLSPRAAPPPPPAQVPVGAGQALTFAGLVVAVPVLLWSMMVWPALVRSVAVQPWVVSWSDPTADAPDPDALVANAVDLLHQVAPWPVELLVGVTVVTWAVRAVVDRWLGPPRATP
ncbi:MAG: hypothetical protein H6733_01825 [Alphaproteobacteria bacterium]|nr:hypothetical protein [Alphaproteobacteria bacterium]